MIASNFKLDRTFFERNKVALIFLSFILISILFNLILFRGLTENNLLLVADQYFPYSYDEAVKYLLYLRKDQNLGTHNAFHIPVRFFDSLFFIALYKINIQTWLAERIHYFFILLSTLTISFTGIYKLSKLEHFKEKRILIIFLITIWYTFNPYTLTLWHGGVFNIGATITYSLAPAILYLFIKAIIYNGKNYQILLLSLLLFMATFVFWLVAPLLLFLLIFSSLYVIIFQIKLLDYLKRLLLLGLFYLLLILPIIYNLYFEYSNIAGYDSPFDTATFGNQAGGLWYQFLMYFSWAIYTQWTPRSLYSFGNFFFSQRYLFGVITLYLIVLIGIIKYKLGDDTKLKASALSINIFKWRNESRHLLVLLVCYGIFLFLAKAGQAPLGEIFIFLYNKIPFFSIFRSADARFGFILVFIVTILILSISKFYKKLSIAILLSIVLILVSKPFFNGEVVRGEEIKGKYYDRIITIPDSHKEVSSFINHNLEPNAEILILPPMVYGHFIYGDSDHHVGQDILASMTKREFIYPSMSTSGMNLISYKKLKGILESSDQKRLTELPAKYVLLRDDNYCKDCSEIKSDIDWSKYETIFQNEVFQLISLNNSASIIGGENIKYQKISPVEYKIATDISGEENQIYLSKSFDKNWDLYLDEASKDSNCIASSNCHGKNLLEIGGVIFNEENSLDQSHSIYNDFGNMWTVRTQSSTSEPTYLTLYYKPQFFLSILAISSMVVLLTHISIVVYLYTKDKRNSQNF